MNTEDRLTNVTLYTARHQAINNARKQGATRLEIAGLFGHISIDTAKIHYGNKSYGKAGVFQARPHPVNLKIIIAQMTPNQLRTALNRDLENPYTKQNRQRQIANRLLEPRQ